VFWLVWASFTEPKEEEKVSVMASSSNRHKPRKTKKDSFFLAQNYNEIPDENSSAMFGHTTSLSAHSRCSVAL
jgi:hypothetical protein